MNDTPKRRRFQVSIREAALLILALGFVLAWWRERQARAPAKERVDSVRAAAATQHASPYLLIQSADCEIGGFPVTIVVSPQGVFPMYPYQLHSLAE